MRTGGRLIVLVGLVIGGVLATGAPAFAHNELTGSDPAEGQQVEQAPEEIRLEFLASVDADNAEFDVSGPDGSSVMADAADVDGDVVLIPVDAGPAGDYEVAWRVLSPDGDWVEGTVAFTVTVGDEPSPSPSPTPAGGPTPSPTPAAVPAASEDIDQGGPAWWIWALIAIVVVAVAGFVGYRFRRRASIS